MYTRPNIQQSIPDLIVSGLNNLNSELDFKNILTQIVNNALPMPIDSKRMDDWQPPADIVDSKENLYVYVELPGVDENSIEIDFYNNKLCISSTKTRNYTGTFVKKEILYGKSIKKIVLPICATNKDNITTSYNNGVLCVIVNKIKEEQNRFKIKIKSRDSDDSGEPSK